MPGVSCQQEATGQGPLRAALNLGNAALVRQAADGSIQGPAADLAHHIAQRLGRPVRLVGYPSAGAIVAAIEQADWDIAFLANDPARTNAFAFSRPYSFVDVCVAVRLQQRAFDVAADVDRPGVRIASTRGTAYDLLLRRRFGHAEIVSCEDVEASVASCAAGEVSCVAGVREGLGQLLAGRSDLRLLPGKIASIEQAVAVRSSDVGLMPLIDHAVCTYQHR